MRSATTMAMTNAAIATMKAELYAPCCWPSVCADARRALMSAKIAATDMAAPTWLVRARIVDAWAIERSEMALSPTTVTGIMTRPTPMPWIASDVVIHPNDVEGVMNALPAAPINIKVKPVTAGRRAPMRSTSRPPIAMLNAVSTAEGVRITPTFSALYPRNFSSYNGTNTARVY